jgi:subtilisin family serine protease
MHSSHSPAPTSAAGSRRPGSPSLIVAVVVALVLGALPAATPTTGLAAAQDVIVVLDPGVDPEAAARDMGVKPTFVYHHVFNGFAGKLPAQTSIAATQRRRGVRRVSPDRPVRVTAQSLPTGVDRIDADQNAGAAIDGIDTRVDADVAVVDTGIANHKDLNIAGGKSCQGKKYRDRNGHGTHVAGTIGALDNGTGVVGVAPGVRLWAVKVLDKNGSGTTGSVICGLDWVVAHAGVIDVVNMSLGGPGPDGDCNDDNFHQAICNVVAAGIPVVVAAGNDGVNAKNFTPAAYDEVITVSAFADSDGEPGGDGPFTCFDDPDDTFAWFSNFGADVDIAAPGECIKSTWLDNGTKRLSGTSMATPHVTGAVALYLAANPLDPDPPTNVRNWLLSDAASRPQSDFEGFDGDPDGSAERALWLGA